MIDDVEEVLLRAYGMLKIYMEGTTKTHQEVVTKATELLGLFNMSNQECIDYVVDKYEENHNIKAYEPDVLVDSNNLPETWLYNRKENTPLIDIKNILEMMIFQKMQLKKWKNLLKKYYHIVQIQRTGVDL